MINFPHGGLILGFIPRFHFDKVVRFFSQEKGCGQGVLWLKYVVIFEGLGH